VILEMLGNGHSMAEVLTVHPELVREDVAQDIGSIAADTSNPIPEYDTIPT